MTNEMYRYGRCMLVLHPDQTGALEFDFTSHPSNQKERFMLDELEIPEATDPLVEP